MHESLLENPPSITIQTTMSVDIFIQFLNKLEGWKTKCKNLHWSAPKKNIHVYLDEFLSVLSDYQDSLAEEYQGIERRIQPNEIKGNSGSATNALDFICEVRDETINFYNSLPQEPLYKGIISECKTFIHNINKYKYLFGLCDIRTY